MLPQTFIHLPGIGPATERELWHAGVLTWDDFIASDCLPPRVRRRHPELSEQLKICRERLAESDGAFFQSCLPSSEYWRTYADFRGRAAFLDIETTGLSPEDSYVTMVGVLDSTEYTACVRDDNLEDLREALEQYDLVVTFNGGSFDLPFLEHHFGRLFGQMAHIDLRHPLRRIGYRGGLKAIEKQLRVGRPSELTGLGGYDAVLLWGMWLKGDASALETLIRYNAEDVASLPALAVIAYNGLLAQVAAPAPALGNRPMPPIDLPYNVELVRQLSARNLDPQRAVAAC